MSQIGWIFQVNAGKYVSSCKSVHHLVIEKKRRMLNVLRSAIPLNLHVTHTLQSGEWSFEIGSIPIHIRKRIKRKILRSYFRSFHRSLQPPSDHIAYAWHHSRHGCDSIFFIRFNSVSESFVSDSTHDWQWLSKIDSNQLTTRNSLLEFDSNRLTTQMAF